MEFLVMEILLPGVIIAAMHFWIGRYPPALPRSENTRRELAEILMMWLFAFVVFIAFMLTLAPEDLRGPPTGALMLRNVAFMIVPFLVAPLAYVVFAQKWRLADLGLRLPLSWPPAIFAVVLFALVGALPLIAGHTEPAPWMLLGFAVYQPAFIEEFFFRVILQGKLERALGQNRAWFYSGILFGLIHVPVDFFGPQFYAGEASILAGFVTLLGQILAGWMFGILYSKTRSIFPGMIAHFATDGRFGSLLLHIFA